MAHTYTDYLSQIVFSTHDRAALILDEILYRYFGGILRKIRAVPIMIGGMPDHVHILARTPASLAPSECANRRLRPRLGPSAKSVRGKKNTFLFKARR